MANDTMLALGSFRFSISTAAYQQLERQSSYKWEEVERFGQAPLMQYCGYDSETISLQGTILPEYKGGLGQMSQMRIQAARGIPLPLVTGTGFFFGLWVIEAINEAQEIFWSNGQPRKIGFQIALKKYDKISLKIGPFNVSTSGLLGSLQ
ncbi:phage tail protein [bacterium]|nr:phage tail protein [bacterium]NBS52844.1 phage tail protein [Spartobacteria bacterium]